MSGWVKLHRSIIDNELWDDKPYSKGQAWIDLLLRARWQDHDKKIAKSDEMLKKGDLIVSYRQLAQDWGWGKTKVGDFINFLDSEKMIKIMRTVNGHLRINNYSSFQSPTPIVDGHTADTVRTVTSEEEPDEPISDPLKNIKKERNELRESKEERSPVDIIEDCFLSRVEETGFILKCNKGSAAYYFSKALEDYPLQLILDALNWWDMRIKYHNPKWVRGINYDIQVLIDSFQANKATELEKDRKKAVYECDKPKLSRDLSDYLDKWGDT